MHIITYEERKQNIREIKVFVVGLIIGIIIGIGIFNALHETIR